MTLLECLGQSGTVLSRTAPYKLEEGLSTIDRTAPGPLRSSDSEVVMLTHFQQSPNGCLGENGTPWGLAAARTSSSLRKDGRQLGIPLTGGLYAYRSIHRHRH